MTQTTLELGNSSGGTVECLGLNFPNDAARREYFTEKLAEHLADPEFRKTPGFPAGTDVDILRLSDPPYYTACPNPFIADFVRLHGSPYDADVPYHREPMGVDVQVGKTDALYKAHGYHTKVPHKAIVPSILHYTQPGDLVLDGFCGSGMTGLAAQWCGTAPSEYRKELEAEWRKAGREKPVWGARRAILSDLSPAATFIAAGFNLPFDVAAFAKTAEKLLAEVEKEVGWMYETLHTDGKTKGRINYTVWSQIFTCPECTGEINFVEEALDEDTKRVSAAFPCPSCRVELTRKRLNSTFETELDPVTGQPHRAPKRRPAIINYEANGETFEKAPEAADLALLKQVHDLPWPSTIPSRPLPYMHMTHERARMDNSGVTHIHHFFLPRAAHALAALWRRATAERDTRIRNALVWWVEQAIWTLSLQNRYRPTGYSQVSQYMTGVYYVPSQHSEGNPRDILAGKLAALFHRDKRGTPKGALAFRTTEEAPTSVVSVADCGRIVGVADDTVDYVFTDPPFGENIYYADLNYLVESWHRVTTDPGQEAIVDRAKKKTLTDYHALMQQCFAEYYRVLKPGRWITVVFSNSSNAVWRAIQESLGQVGFFVAEVRALDKKQRSYRQVTSTAVKQDLVVSAYKPSVPLGKPFELGQAGADSAWRFVSQHLTHLPRFMERAEGGAEVVAERTPARIFDRMVAFHVQRRLSAPLSLAEFLSEGANRYVERDGMWFLGEQVAEYDKKRHTLGELKQLTLFVTDENSARQWLRRELTIKPRRIDELYHDYMLVSQRWAKHEQTVELKDLLRQGFIEYDGAGPVPGPIHTYLSSNYRELRNLEKHDPALVQKALHRWYVPDPRNEADLEKLRRKHLLIEYEKYKLVEGTRGKAKLTQFRSEALRAGFAVDFEKAAYESIIAIVKRLPDIDEVIYGDELLSWYYDNAKTQLGVD